MKQHVKSVHEGVQYPCGKCTFKARTNNCLRDHIKAVHEGIVYTCSACPFYRAAKKYNLQRHIETKHKVREEEDPNIKLEPSKKKSKKESRTEGKAKRVRMERKSGPCTDVKPGKGKRQRTKLEKKVKREVGPSIEIKLKSGPCSEIKPEKGNRKRKRLEKQVKIEVGPSIEIKQKKNVQLNYSTLLESYRAKNEC